MGGAPGSSPTQHQANTLTLLVNSHFSRATLDFQSALRGGKTNFLHLQRKDLQGQEFSGMFGLKIFLERQKAREGGACTAPPPAPRALRG